MADNALGGKKNSRARRERNKRRADPGRFRQKKGAIGQPASGRDHPRPTGGAGWPGTWHGRLTGSPEDVGRFRRRGRERHFGGTASTRNPDQGCAIGEKTLRPSRQAIRIRIRGPNTTSASKVPRVSKPGTRGAGVRPMQQPDCPAYIEIKVGRELGAQPGVPLLSPPPRSSSPTLRGMNPGRPRPRCDYCR